MGLCMAEKKCVSFRSEVDDSMQPEGTQFCSRKPYDVNFFHIGHN